MNNSSCSILTTCYDVGDNNINFISGKYIIGRPAWVYLEEGKELPLFINIHCEYGNSWYRDVFLGYYIPIDANANEIQCFYNYLGNDYNRKCEYMNDIYNALSKMIQEMFISKKIKILDLMGGAGRLSFLLYNLGYINIDLIDNSDELIEVSKSTLADIRYIHEDGINYSYENSYDLIVCSLGLHHLSLDNKMKVLNKVKNALNKNGIFMSLENNIFIPYSFHFPNIEIKDISIKSKQYGVVQYKLAICRN